VSQSKQEVIAEFTKLLDEFESGRLWGSVEVLFQKGVATIIRKEVTRNLTQENRGNTHETRNYR